MIQNSKGNLPIMFTKIGRWWGNDPVRHIQSEIDLIASDGKLKWMKDTKK